MLKLNKNLISLFFGLNLFWLAVCTAHAEKADRNKPVNIESNAVVVDDAKQISTFEGNVQLTQGTLFIRADKLIVRQDKDKQFQYGIAYGRSAYFRQKREGVNEHIEGFAERIEYDSKNDFIQLFHGARVKRNDDEARGEYISYDSRTEIYKVLNSIAKQGGVTTSGGGRVRVLIQPKNKDNPEASKPAAPATLQKPTTLPSDFVPTPPAE